MKTPVTGQPVDLADYTYGELKGLLFDVANAIREREREQVVQARARIAAIAADAGIPLDTLFTETEIDAQKKR